jgi:colanic acid biosynthesis protein WcaH
MMKSGPGREMAANHVDEIGRMAAIEALRSAAGDPRGDLPEDLFLFVSSITPLINVDLLIQDGAGRTLLTWRDDEFYGAGWHVPGGIIRFRETAEERLRATALRELGADVSFDPAPVAIEQGIHPTRRERGHLIGLLYRCRLLSEPDEALRFCGAAPQSGEWAWHTQCPDNLIPFQDGYRRFL